MDTEQTPFPATPAPRSGNIGPLAAAVIIVVLLAAGGFYFFYNQQQKQEAAEAQATLAQNPADANAQPADPLEAELNATQTSGSDADMQGLNNSL